MPAWSQVAFPLLLQVHSFFANLTLEVQLSMFVLLLVNLLDPLQKTPLMNILMIAFTFAIEIATKRDLLKTYSACWIFYGGFNVDYGFVTLEKYGLSSHDKVNIS